MMRNLLIAMGKAVLLVGFTIGLAVIVMSTIISVQHYFGTPGIIVGSAILWVALFTFIFYIE